MGRRWTLVAGLLILAAETHAAENRGFSLSVLVGGEPIPELRGRDAVYVEALRGRPYALRITNPLACRVAVALSVDGLNTIDAGRTDAWSARKWVLDPHETATIPGWQVSGSAAREFFFTGEKSSYGASLGKAENLGVIEAVFYRERAPVPVPMSAAPLPAPAPPPERRDGARSPENAPREVGGVVGGVAGGTPSAPPSKAQALSDDYAATGMGRRDRHEVEDVYLTLAGAPLASVRIRYEFRPQLVKLGFLPRLDPLERREAAAGFSSFCPEPSR